MEQFAYPRVARQIQPTNNCPFKFTNFWENITIHIQITFRRVEHDAKAQQSVVGKDLAKALLDFLEQFQHVEPGYLLSDPPKTVTREMALAFCEKMLQEGLLVPSSPRTRNGSVSAFSPDKSYQLSPFNEDLRGQLSDIMGRRSTSSNGSASSLSSTGTESSTEDNLCREIRYEIFQTIFGPAATEITDDDVSMDGISIDSDDDGSVSSEKLLAYWESNFKECVNAWREVSLMHLLVYFNLETLETFIHAANVEEDIIPVMSNAVNFTRTIKFSPLFEAALEVLDDSPQFLSSLLQNKGHGAVHPLVLIGPIRDHSITRFATKKSARRSVMDKIQVNKSPDGGILPASHTELLQALHQLIGSARPRTDTVTALQLYLSILPWLRRDYLKKLLWFLHLMCLPGVPLLNRNIANHFFILEKFVAVVFPTMVPEQSGREILYFMLEHAAVIFEIPAGLGDELKACLIRSGQLGRGAPRRNFCCARPVLVEHFFEDGKGKITSEELYSLLKMTDAIKDPRERLERLKAFITFYPNYYAKFFGSHDPRKDIQE
ncbi:hypothetical protein BV898_04358 [Hypsibius exemplaris]|uniref:Uncharacterized protein n=1 Tax=Hypsibius exemplaris TaxID=2072580 RepID=A0A1W0X3C1_HYPEX|nr:hypothetical protein BV898_04358 [Hypsibius exemplaris]